MSRSLGGTLGLGGLVMVAGGCAQLFGIDNTTSGSGSAAVDAPDLSSRLSVDRYSVGTSIVQAPLDTTLLAPAIFFAGDVQTVAVGSGNSWSIPTPSDTVEYFLPDVPTSIPRQISLPSSKISQLFGQLEHPNPSPAPVDASWQVDVVLPAAVVAGDSFQLFTVGSWTQFGLSASVGVKAISQAVSFSGTTSLSGRPLDKVTTADTVLVLGYTGDALSSFYQAPPLDQGDDVTPISGTLAPTGAPLTLTASLMPSLATARFALTQPAETAASFGFALNAAPGFAIANLSGPQLRNGAAPMDGPLALAFANPFQALGWHSTFQYAPTVSRAYTPAAGANAGLPSTLFAQLFELVDADAAPAVTVDLPAGLPTSITLEDTPLISDGLTITADVSTRLHATFTVDSEVNTLYQMQVLELVPNGAGTALQFKVELGLTGLDHDFKIPPNILQVGHDYVLRAICVSGGYPGLDAGDLTQRTLPFSVGLLDSGAFTVAAP